VLAPYFNGVKRAPLLFASHVISASSFIISYLQFQKEREAVSGASDSPQRIEGYRNVAFFLGVGATSFLIWVLGTGVGYGIALGFPPGFEEALKFILPGYFTGLLVVEMKGRAMPLICGASLLAAIPGALVSPGWGWLATAVAVATLGWALEQWKTRAS
jgi:predicted branched-subunit amino acid permease